jgi:hypothetical protein
MKKLNFEGQTNTLVAFCYIEHQKLDHPLQLHTRPFSIGTQ